MVGVGGDWLREIKGEIGGGVGQGGGEVQRGSVAGEDDMQELKAGITTVANITQ